MEQINIEIYVTLMKLDNLFYELLNFQKQKQNNK